MPTPGGLWKDEAACLVVGLSVCQRVRLPACLQVGPHICVFKTHVDIFDKWDSQVVERLQQLAAQHGAGNGRTDRQTDSQIDIRLAVFRAPAVQQGTGNWRTDRQADRQPDKWTVDG
jgi:Orotidine 5'-phosphate decarboxylase / HUMPS family